MFEALLRPPGSSPSLSPPPPLPRSFRLPPISRLLDAAHPRQRKRRREHARVLVDARVAAPRRVCCEGWHRGGEFVHARAETANDELIAPPPRVLVDASLRYVARVLPEIIYRHGKSSIKNAEALSGAAPRVVSRGAGANT